MLPVMLPMCTCEPVPRAMACMPMPQWSVAATAAAADRRTRYCFQSLLLLLALYMLSHCIKIFAVLLSAARARIVVLVLQPLVAEEANLVPAATETPDIMLSGVSDALMSYTQPGVKVCSHNAAHAVLVGTSLPPH